MNDQLEEEPAERFIPIDTIEDIVSQPILHSVILGGALRQIDYSDYNYALDLSLQNMFSEMPLKLLQASLEPDYCDQIRKYVCSHNKKCPEEEAIPLPPHEQIIYEGKLDSVFCYNLHLANVYPNELHLCFIGLQNPLQSNQRFDQVLNRKYRGLGHGVFDTIFKRIEDYAAEYGYDMITLRAANGLLRSIYERRGYSHDRSKPSSTYHSMKKVIS